MNPVARPTRGTLLRGARPFVGGLLLAFVGAAASAQQNPIITATQAPPPYGGSPYGIAVSPYGYGSPYGQPYGYPYQSYNPSLNQLTNPPQQNGTNGGVPSQPSVPGQTQIGGGGGGSGGGGGGGGGNNGGNGGGSKTDGAGYGSTGQANGASYEILQNPDSPLYKRYERHDNSQQPLRPEILTQIGRGKGIRRGFIEESHRIAATLEATATRLDARFDFQKQMIGEHLVPPVIGEVHDLRESGGDRLLYLTVGSYQIVRSARLVLTPPSWRDYLVIEPAETQTSISALAPQNGQEQSVYDHAYDDGLAKGISEARGTFEANLDRLQRDYAGMERYHELAEKGAVSIPVVKDARRSVHLTDRGQRALVGEQVVRLQVSPKFKAARPGAFK